MEEDIPDDFVVQPYMYEPEMETLESSCSSESESEFEETTGDETESRMGNRAWCQCGNCEALSTEIECKCCKDYPELVEKLEGMECIVQHEGFRGNCLNPDVLEVSFYEFLQGNGPIGDEEPIHEIYRYIAYRRLARWIWHRLGKKDRRVLPACAVKKIREQFPSEGFTGFQYVHRDLC